MNLAPAALGVRTQPFHPETLVEETSALKEA